MACLVRLKDDVKLIEQLFPRGHPRFRVDSASVDDLTFTFVAACGRGIVIHATFTDTYPRTAPLWFSDGDDATVEAALQAMQDATAPDCNILRQIGHLVSNLCKLHDVDIPAEVDRLLDKNEVDASGSSAADDEEDDAPADMEEEFHYEMESGTSDAAQKEEYDGIDTQNVAELEKLKQLQRDDYLKGSVHGSVQATARLMKELQDVYKSDSYKEGIYGVELVNDSLYDWNIRLIKVDPDSALANDLAAYKEKGYKDGVLLNFTFKDAFPFEPPFVRVISPVIHGGYVLAGGAICMEVLTKQGWSSAYSIESLILQIAATLVKGKARIQFNASSKGVYNLAKAQQSFKSLVQIHEKNGWYTPPKEDG